MTTTPAHFSMGRESRGIYEDVKTLRKAGWVVTRISRDQSFISRDGYKSKLLGRAQLAAFANHLRSEKTSA